MPNPNLRRSKEHYRRLVKLRIAHNEKTFEIRFWRRVKKSNPSACWPWTGSRTPDGYGYLRRSKKHVTAHRAAWEWANGPIPEGLFVCHTCDNVRCCNPNHLFLGTHRKNMEDMAKKGRAKGNKPRRKLSKDEVITIRGKKRVGFSLTELAKEFGRTRGTIHRITTNKIWKF